MKRVLSILTVSICILSALTAGQAAAILEADFSLPKTAVNPNLYGIFFEDINYGADGGLYAELIQNRSFEFKFGTESWDVIKPDAKNKTRIRLKKENPLNTNNPKYAQLDITAAGTGIANKGFGGIPLTAGHTYNGTIFLRSNNSAVTKASIIIDDGEQTAVTARTQITGITNEWKKFTYTLTPSKTSDKGRLIVLFDETGSIDIDMFSLFPAKNYKEKSYNFREDLAEKIEKIQPKFIRFPGGCVVEGRVIEEAYRWKDTIGPIEQRKEAPNFWGYQQSYGIGFHEYFEYCRDLNAEPVPVINCHMSFADRDIQYINLSTLPDFQEWVQDALDLIEYANGPVTSVWGAKRAENGSPEPFNMKYLGIGNEQFHDSYFTRYEAFAQAIKEKHPEIKLILSSGPLPNGLLFETAWSKAGQFQSKGLVDLIDEHYYCTPEWFLTNNKRYDSYDRSKTKVFVGEYAAHAEGKRNNLFAAVAEAAFMTGLERNGDVVEIASYAPLFAKDGFTQWIPDMIWFNNTQSYGTPSYYTQLMYSNNQTAKTVSHTLSINASETKAPIIGGSVGLGTWATQAVYQNIKVTDPSGSSVYFDSNKIRRMTGLHAQTGDWSQSGKVFIQSAGMDNCRLVVEGAGWDNYTYTVQAVKKSGNEGFLILFGVKGNALYWWNIGGWGNTQSCIEKGTVDARSVVSESKPIRIENDRQYDIKVEVHGDTIKCYLDGQLMHTLVDAQSYDPIYAHIGETSDNEIVIKIVNAANEPKNVDMRLKNAGNIESSAQLTFMNAKDSTAENSFKNPTAVVPVAKTLDNIGPDFTFNALENSVNIIRIKRQK